MKNFKNKKELTGKTGEDNRAKEEMICVSSSDGKEMVCSPGGAIKKVEAQEIEKIPERKNNLFIGTLNFFATPYRGLKEGYKKRYSGAEKLFIIDLVLLGIVGLLAGFNVYLFFSRTTIYPFSLSSVGESTEGNVLPENVSGFLTQIKINGQENIIVSPGEDLEYKIFYQNKGNKIIYDVSLKINLEGAILDFEKIQVEKGALRDNAVVWTKDQIAEFSELPPGAKGEVKFKIGTKKAADPARAINFGSLLRSSTETSYKLERNFGEAVHFSGRTREDKINSDLTIISIARYFSSEGDQLGRGQLPPAVGKTTKYWIFWSAENNLNDLSGVSVSAILPPNVSWTENISVSLGELSYNSARRAVTWKIGEMGRYGGEERPKQGVAFELALTPTVGEVGREALLLDQIKIFGKDKFTGQFLERTGTDLTTELIYDSLANGKGKVVK